MQSDTTGVRLKSSGRRNIQRVISPGCRLRATGLQLLVGRVPSRGVTSDVVYNGVVRTRSRGCARAQAVYDRSRFAEAIVDDRDPVTP
jgi:hypothetical protein